MRNPHSVIAALRRGNLAVRCTNVFAGHIEIPAASAGMTESLNHKLSQHPPKSASIP